MTTQPPENTPDDEDSRVDVYVITNRNQIRTEAPHKADEPLRYVMYDAAHPEGDKLYFTEAEWEAFILGVRNGEFDLYESGNFP